MRYILNVCTKYFEEGIFKYKSQKYELKNRSNTPLICILYLVLLQVPYRLLIHHFSVFTTSVFHLRSTQYEDLFVLSWRISSKGTLHTNKIHPVFYIFHTCTGNFWTPLLLFYLTRGIILLLCMLCHVKLFILMDSYCASFNFNTLMSRVVSLIDNREEFGIFTDFIIIQY